MATIIPGPEIKSAIEEVTSTIELQYQKWPGLNQSSIQRTRQLLFGPSKSGKTTFGAEFHSKDGTNLIIAAESGWHGVRSPAHVIGLTQERNRIEESTKKKLSEWDIFLKIIETAPLEQYDCIVVDTVTALSQFCNDAICKKLGVQDISDAKWSKGWRALAMDWARAAHQLWVRSKNLLWICHEKSEEVDGLETKRLRITYDAVKPLKRVINESVDIILMVRPSEPRNVMTRTPGQSKDVGDRFHLSLPDPFPLDGAEWWKALYGD